MNRPLSIFDQVYYNGTSQCITHFLKTENKHERFGRLIDSHFQDINTSDYKNYAIALDKENNASLIQVEFYKGYSYNESLLNKNIKFKKIFFMSDINCFYLVSITNKIYQFNINFHTQVKEIPFSISIESVHIGCTHLILLTKSKKLYSMGFGEHGELGLGNECIKQSTPAEIQLTLPVKKLFICQDTNFVILENDTLFAFGWNFAYCLTLNEHRVFLPTQLSIDNVNTINKITSTRSSSFILFENGDLFSCGQKNTNGHNMDLSSFKKIEKIKKPIRDIQCGTYHCFASINNLESYAWGYNYNQQFSFLIKGIYPLPKKVKFNEISNNYTVKVEIPHTTHFTWVYAYDNEFYEKYWILRHYFYKDIVKLIVVK